MSNNDQQAAAAAPKPKKKRVEWLDIMRGAVMFLVILGHVTKHGATLKWIYSFHMPSYFLISGMTFAFNKRWGLKEFAWNKFYGLMIPYLVLSVYAAPLREWLERIGECNMQTWKDLILGTLYSNADSGLKMSSNTLWFIPCLFVSTMVFFFIMKAAKALAGTLPEGGSGNAKPNGAKWEEIYATILTLAVVGIAWALGLNIGSGGMWHYKAGIFATLFLLIGYLFMRHITVFQQFIETHKAAALILMVILFVIGDLISIHNGSVSMIRNRYHFLPWFYISALLSSFAVVILMMVVTDLGNDQAAANAAAGRSDPGTVKKLLKPINFIGVNTLPYIAFQVPVMKLMWHYMPNTFGTHAMGWALFQTVIVYFAFIPFSWLVDKGIPKKKAKK
jgi:acyltransferase